MAWWNADKKNRRSHEQAMARIAADLEISKQQEETKRLGITTAKEVDLQKIKSNETLGTMSIRSKDNQAKIASQTSIANTKYATLGALGSSAITAFGSVLPALLSRKSE